jgi:ribonucleoside-diphosphate reductase alpha chain
MKISRRFTQPQQDVFATVEWTKRDSRIANPDGSVVFEMNGAEVPAHWSQLATDIVVSKYFRKAGVPQYDDEGTPLLDESGKPITGPERSVRQVVHRLAGCWRHWGERHGYFDSAKDAEAFYDELSHMLLNQMAAPNSPQWFNTGLHWAYGITGPAQGHWDVDPESGQVQRCEDAYSHPQPHACFIQSVSDDLVGDGGIMDLWTREARLFKYGSGTGTNFSALRGEDEPLSGGGKSSGLMSFLKIGDRAAGAIKSGGTTRRAAKMVCIDADHPDIESFVNWKAREELKVAAMVEGLKQLPQDQRQLAETLGLQLDYDFNGEAYHTVSGQNANNSVRLGNDFFRQVEADGDWDLIRRVDGKVSRTIKAHDLWDQICNAAWRCADPGVQFDSTINQWHTCPAEGRINASNPCSEYMFVDDTACNLASINLLKFFDAQNGHFQVDLFEHAIELWTVVLEISVLMAAFPSEQIARQSYRTRTLGLGYANLGALLMQAGIPYDSEHGRAVCGTISAILTGRSYATSAQMASQLGPFPAYPDNRDSMLRVIRNHRRAAYGTSRRDDAYEGLDIKPTPIDHEQLHDCQENITNSDDLLQRAMRCWDDALEIGVKSGYRNAQTTVIAPTGTIGLLMDCDTTGVEPDFALTKFKKLAGGGYFKIANRSLRPALVSLGYAPGQIEDILKYVMGTLRLDVPMPEVDNANTTFRDYLLEQGYTETELHEVEQNLPTIFELRMAFGAWAIPTRMLNMNHTDPETARNDPSFNGLRLLGLKQSQISTLNRLICGTQTIEGAPHLNPAHLPVFDCANKCGPMSQRFIATDAHIRMMASAQPFISGAISKTINLPAEADVDDIAAAYRLSWKLGLKANALYRDGSKLSQPLNTSSELLDESEDEDDVDGVEAAIEEVAGEVMAAAHATTAMDQLSQPATVERIVERIVERPLRRRLPDTRKSLTHRFNVAGHEGYLTVGLYEDGSPGELFITMSKEGSTIGGLMDSLGTAISVALQYGVPTESLVTKFAHQRFEPMGMTTSHEIPFAKSLVDYIFRWMGMEFVHGYREANAPRRTATATHSDSPSSNTRDVKEDKTWSELESDNGAESATQRLRTNTNTNANGNGRPEPEPGDRARTGEGCATATPTTEPYGAMDAGSDDVSADPSGATATALDHSNAALQGDAPACDVCGSITVRNGTCYKCLNCGNSMGCS